MGLVEVFACVVVSKVAACAKGIRFLYVVVTSKAKIESMNAVLATARDGETYAQPVSALIVVIRDFIRSLLAICMKRYQVMAIRTVYRIVVIPAMAGYLIAIVFAGVSHYIGCSNTVRTGGWITNSRISIIMAAVAPVLFSILQAMRIGPNIYRLIDTIYPVRLGTDNRIIYSTVSAILAMARITDRSIVKRLAILKQFIVIRIMTVCTIL
jgi:hypothetical protein